MKLVDTSSWVQQIRRRGDPAVRARMEQLLRAGEAAWCPVVRLELWAGAGIDFDRKLLRAFRQRIPSRRSIAGADTRSLSENREGPHSAMLLRDPVNPACGNHFGVQVGGWGDRGATPDVGKGRGPLEDGAWEFDAH